MIRKKITTVLAVGAILSLPVLSSCTSKKVLAEQQAQLTSLQQEIDKGNAELQRLNDEIHALEAQRDQLKATLNR